MPLALLVASMLGERIAHRAQQAAGHRSVREISPHANDDCSGFARAVYGREGIDLSALPPLPGENGVANIHRLARARRALRRAPRPGDLVFFRDTLPRRKGLTHVGVVEAVRGSEVIFVHRAGKGIVRSRLDLRHTHSTADNDFIKRGGQGPRLAGELLAGFASPDRLSASSARATARWRGRDTRRTSARAPASAPRQACTAS